MTTHLMMHPWPDDGSAAPPYQADPILLLYRRPGTVGCYGYEADGTPWGTFHGTAVLPCALCGAGILYGWMRSPRVHSASPVSGPHVVCVDHVRYTSATLAPEVR